MIERFQGKYRISSARLPNWDYGWNGRYFITICTAGRHPFFGVIDNKNMVLSEIGLLVRSEWEKSFVLRPGLFCDASVIMPNHIHAILRIENNAFLRDKKSNFGVARRSPKSISSFAACFKSMVTVNARKINSAFGWQTRFHDHIIRNDEEYQRIANYIENNPANWGMKKYFN